MDISTFIWWLLFLCFVCIPQGGKTESNLEGDCEKETPPSFQLNFLRNCTEVYDHSEDKCNTAWNNFLKAFENKRSEDVQQEDYNLYFDTLPFTISRDHCLFWSGTRDLAEILTMMEESGVDMMTSHTVPAAQLINEFGFDLCWCSSPGNYGFDTERKCPKSTTVHFWAQFGVRLALQARGSVFYVVDGMRNPAYRRTSLFSCYELQNLDPMEVTQLVVLNVHTKGELCGTQSLAELCDDAMAREIACKCYDIEGMVENSTQRDAIVRRLAAKINEVQNSKQETPSPGNNANKGNSGTSHCQYSAVVTLLIFQVYSLEGAI